MQLSRVRNRREPSTTRGWCLIAQKEAEIAAASDCSKTWSRAGTNTPVTVTDCWQFRSDDLSPTNAASNAATGGDRHACLGNLSSKTDAPIGTSSENGTSLEFKWNEHCIISTTGDMSTAQNTALAWWGLASVRWRELCWRRLLHQNLGYCWETSGECGHLKRDSTATGRVEMSTKNCPFLLNARLQRGLKLFRNVGHEHPIAHDGTWWWMM